MITNRKLATHQINTAEQLFALPNDGNRYELVKGTLKVMSPAGSEHGWIAGRILTRLATHVEQFDLGRTYAAETGFLISTDPDTVRAPDACFVSHQKLATVEPTKSFLPLAPDLVVEVVSPNDLPSEIEGKAKQWLRAGSQVVLIADSTNQTMRVYRGDSQVQVLRKGETFDAGEVCSGWTLSINDAFEIKD